jgi:hypothetical protein
MEVKSITDGKDDTEGAFCPKKMAAEGVDNYTLCEALNNALAPFAGLLKDGHGFGAYVNGDDGTVIGFSAPEKSSS